MATAEFKGINLQVGQERILNVTLQPNTVNTEINVSGGDLTVIDVSSAKIGASVNEREVAKLPLNGRQVSQLYLLAPGFTEIPGQMERTTELARIAFPYLLFVSLTSLQSGPHVITQPPYHAAQPGGEGRPHAVALP